MLLKEAKKGNKKVVRMTESQLFGSNCKTNNDAQFERQFRKILPDMQRFIS